MAMEDGLKNQQIKTMSKSWELQLMIMHQDLATLVGMRPDLRRSHL